MSSGPTNSANGVVVQSNGIDAAEAKHPAGRKTLAARRLQLQRLAAGGSDGLDTIVANSRVLIIEGISGAGKDTFQKYLKAKLRDRIVYDYSEGELLLSWNQRPIKDIFRLQIRLMKNFIDYIADTIHREPRAVFLLNRFHLSTYTMGVTEQPNLEREYNIVLRKLRCLPAHVFILQLMESEIESRSSHPERGAAWHKFQQHILEREGFQNFLNRNVRLQRVMVETAIRQQIPYSVFRLPSAINAGVNGRHSPLQKSRNTLGSGILDRPAIQHRRPSEPQEVA